ncbi:MAG: NAD(P)/FAD-dependent oxidoreductase [Bryobacterales bacterium]|nr:NAD(P)/FAD-dependent oxidoreductase [Bryobacterales bacterium]
MNREASRAGFSRRRLLQGAGVAGLGLAGYGAYAAAACPPSEAKGRVVVVGGGAAGLDIAARLRCALPRAEITVIDPARVHYYQPGFTMVACGEFTPEETQRPEETLIPGGVRWLADRVEAIDAAANRLTTRANGVVPYDYLVLTPGLEMHFAAIEGISRERLGEGNVHCIYDVKSAQACWTAIQKLSESGGRAYFTDTWTKLKCGGAPKKINMMAEDYCRRQGTRDRVDFQFYTAGKELFEVPLFRKRLDAIYAERNLAVTPHHRIQSVDTRARRVTFEIHEPGQGKAGAGGSGAGPAPAPRRVTREFDFLHIVPPMTPPGFVLESALMEDPETGKAAQWVPTDAATLRHARFGNVFVAGDVAGIPTSKTAAAVRMQAPVVAENLIAAMEGRKLTAAYDGYTACPFTTEYGKVLMAEFDYAKTPKPSIPFVDPGHEHRPGWILKRYMLKPAYFDLMLRGRM